MQKKIKNMINFLFSLAFIAVMSFSGCMNTFAADSSGKATVSKGMTVFIMISIFIVTAVITGFVSFKIRRDKIRRSADDTSSEKNKE